MNQSKPLRVALLTTAFPRWAGDGRAPWILETARALRLQGVDVRVLTVHGTGSREFEVLEGIPIHRVRYLWPDRFERLQDIGGGLPVAWRAGWLYRISFVPFFLALIWAAIWDGRQVDVIHAHWTLAGWAAWAASYVTGKPFVLTVHGSDIYIAPKIRGIGALTRALLHRSRRVIAASQDMAQATRGLGLLDEAVEVIPYGVELERFVPGATTREPLLLFVGALIPRKGADVLLEALPAIRAHCPDLKLIIVGEGAERAALEQQARRLGIENAVTFTGPQSRAETATWMRKARVFVLPSHEEAFGVVLIEALASGTPCVATRVGGIVDIVTPDVGVLVAPNDPQALAEAIIAIWQDRERWAEFSLRARRRVEHDGWTWSAVAERLTRIYARAIDRAV